MSLSQERAIKNNPDKALSIIEHLKKELEARDEKISEMRGGLLDAIDRIEKIRYGWSFLEIHLIERLRKLTGV